MNSSTPANEPIIIGQISGVFGVHGWVKVFSFTDPRKNILTYKPWLIRNKSDWQTIEIVKGRTQGKTLVAQIEGVNDKDQAHALIGSDIAIAPEQLRSLEDNSFYWRELIGLDVEEAKSGLIGKVQSMMATGANDVLVVVGKDEAGKKRELLIPYLLDDVIKNIDLDKKLILVDWDESFEN